LNGRLGLLCLLPALWGVVGCVSGFGPAAENGIVFYAPGAGNIDFGDRGLREGLERAGYRGQVATVMWTFSFNPAFDQVVRGNALLGAKQLARKIEQYIDEYPGRPVHLVGLSAGTGVVVWALEDLKSGYAVDNVVLLASSLSHDYDMSKALRHVRGKVYNYYSPNDAVLTVLMIPFGTIDGKLGADAAGAVGLNVRRRDARIVNIGWRPEFRRYNNYGAHQDGTQPRFVQAFVARHLLSDAGAPQADDARVASQLPTTPPAAHRD